MKKPSLRTRALAPAVILAVGALVATPALAQVSAEAAAPAAASTATPTAPAADAQAPTAEPRADEAAEAPKTEAPTAESPEAEAPEGGSPEAAPSATESDDPSATQSEDAEEKPTVTFPDHPDNSATRTIGKNFKTTVAYTGATPGDKITVIINGITQTHGEGTYVARETVTDTDGEFYITANASYLDTVASGTDKASDVIQVRVGTTRNHVRVTEEAAPSLTFPEYPDNSATRTIGEDFTARVAYTGATAGDPVMVVVNGYTQAHGGDTFEAPATVTEADGEFDVTLPASFLDEVSSSTADDQDVLQVRVGNTRNHVRITEEPAEVSPTVRMDYPLPAQTVHDTGIEVRVATAPHAPVDITKTSVQFTGGYTLELPDEWDGTADENGDYVFTIAPDTPITSSFRPERDTSVGQLSDGDGITVQVNTAGKSTSFTTRVEGTAEEAKPTVTFPNNPEGTAERKAGEAISLKVNYEDVNTGDPISVVANGEVLTHGEEYESIQKTDYVRGGFFVRLDGEFLDRTRAEGDPERDTVEVRVGEGSATIDILELSDEPTEEPTDEPTEEPTDAPTEEPTEEPTDGPTDEPTEAPTDDPTEEPTDDPTVDPTDDPTTDPTDDPTDDNDDDQGDELALSIDPDRIRASDFVDAERGVILTVTGLEPGEDIEFSVAPTSGQNVDPAELPATATEDGVASTVVYGTTSIDPTAYIGDYDVSVSGVDEAGAQAGAEAAADSVAATEAEAAEAGPDSAADSSDGLSGTFTVTSDDESTDDGSDGGSDDGSNGGGSGDGSKDDGTLPRTGSELGGLAAGAAMLAVGAAAVAVTRRRMNQG